MSTQWKHSLTLCSRQTPEWPPHSCVPPAAVSTHVCSEWSPKVQCRQNQTFYLWPENCISSSLISSECLGPHLKNWFRSDACWWRHLVPACVVRKTVTVFTDNWFDWDEEETSCPPFQSGADTDFWYLHQSESIFKQLWRRKQRLKWTQGCERRKSDD